MTNTNIVNVDLGNVKSDVLVGLTQIDMTVEPYSEVKKFLDEKARETMYKLKAVANDVLSFAGDENEQ